MKYERIIMVVFLLLLCTDIITLPLSTVVDWLSNGMGYIINFIPFL